MKAPSVIIGVGGIGSQICARVEAQLSRAEKNTGGKQRGDSNIRFVALDTDVNSLRELYRHGFRGKRILLTDNMTVAKCRDIIRDQAIDKWYPKNSIFKKKSMTEGAGQQRSISRLAFEYCLRDGRLNQLDNVVRELNELVIDDSSQQTRFYIISSLAGGTGSGVVLPLAMYLNHFIQSEQGDDLAICKGFFILSSAFYASCESELEKKSLDANAYAAIKELSAFMRNADNEESSPRLSYPLYGCGEYSGSTYEYCYLFGLTNAKSKNIHSFEHLKDMVADAVYMQACSPMHDSNSSREDNTVRHTTVLGVENQEKWRRHFGGIGCGRLIYPYEDLSRYLGLCWAKDTMEQDWRKYDEEYRKIRKKQQSMKYGKRKNEVIDQGIYYIKAVDKADPEDCLAACIREQCRRGEGAEPWKCYLKAVEEEAYAEIEALFEGYRSNPKWVLSEENKGKLTIDVKTKQAKKDRYQAAVDLHNRWIDLKNELEERKNAIYMDNRLFRLHRWNSDEEEDELKDCYLEYWFVTEERRFIHPNSIRYFLYQLEKSLDERKPQNDEINLDSPFKPVKRQRLSYAKGVNLYKEFEKKFNLLKRKLNQDLIEQFMKQCRLYVKKLIDCYEELYAGYDLILDEFSADIKTIEKKLDQVRGVSYSFVCADDKCRKKLHEELSERRGYEENAVSTVSYELYGLIHKVGLESGKMATRECADRIKNFWYMNIEKEAFGKDLLDMNILEAMNRDEEYHTGIRLDEDGFRDKIQRVQEVLVAPFLQYFQRIDMNMGISLCCYNSKLDLTAGVYKNVVDWLKNINAVDDDTYCSVREIMFYRSFVGLEAYEVLDYLHGISAETAVTGRAFRSYQSLIHSMGKGSGNMSKVITPHADIRWHSLFDMPDPSQVYQEEQERYITNALLYAWLSGKIWRLNGSRAYGFFLTDRETAEFERLYDCHLHLYGNYYWYMELCKAIQVDILDARNKNRDCYKQICRQRDWSAFDLILEYQAGLYYGECTDRQRQVLAEAAVWLIYECTMVKDEKVHRKNYLAEIKRQSEKTFAALKCRRLALQLSHEKVFEIPIEEALASDIEDFLHQYLNNITKWEF